jgi:hypothetical protein
MGDFLFLEAHFLVTYLWLLTAKNSSLYSFLSVSNDLIDQRFGYVAAISP